MQKQSKKMQWGLGLLVALFLLFAMIGATWAGYNATPFAGSVAKSYQYHTHNAPNGWTAHIESTMDNGVGPAIDKIGWSSWNTYDRCNGAFVDEHHYGGTEGKNVSYQGRIRNEYIADCPVGPRQTVSNGSHMYIEGGSNITPYVSEYSNYP